MALGAVQLPAVLRLVKRFTALPEHTLGLPLPVFIKLRLLLWAVAHSRLVVD
jgi:hypothetical protein